MWVATAVHFTGQVRSSDSAMMRGLHQREKRAQQPAKRREMARML